MDAQNLSQKVTPVEFKGSTREYFGIWIVNLMLTLVTFGIYSAWAKVRRKKYFYNNTLIDNVGFDYHAKPIAILKGRIIAFVFFMLYSFTGSISPLLPMLLGLVLFIAIPWIIVRSTLFNARNTSHRGLRFDFVGTVTEARKVFMFLPMLLLFTFGLIYPYIAHQKNQFLMSNHRFGLTQFDMKSVVGKFYKVYLLGYLLPVFVVGILAAIALPAYKSYVDRAKAAQHSGLQLPSQIAKSSLMGFAPITEHKIVLAENVAAPESAEIKKVEPVYVEDAPEAAQQAAEVNPINTAEEPTSSAQVPDASPISAEEGVAQEAASQTGAEVQMEEEVAEEVSEPTPKEKTFEELMKEREEARKHAFANLLETIKKNPGVLFGMVGGLMAYAFFIFGYLGYIKARVGNLVWNNTTLDQLSFKSSLRARDYIWIYFTNILAIACTFGLTTPWAQIRLAKYRASKLQIIGDVNFDQFVGEKKEELKATGEEIADFFDVDLSFG